MRIPLCCSDRESGTFTRPYPLQYHEITKRLHNKCRRESCLVVAAKILQRLFHDHSQQSAFPCLFHPHKEIIPCGLI